MKAIMVQRRASALLLALLLVFPLVGLTEADSRQDTLLYYNREGSRHYHADPKCQSIHADYYPYLVSFGSRELHNYKALTPCAMCTVAESLGKKQIIAWKITPEKDHICLLLSDGSGETSEIALELVGSLWIVRAANTRDTIEP